MAHKQFALDEQTIITIYKRKSSRSLRLSIAATGEIRVSIPTWAPYSAGITFARSRQAWIEQQRKPAEVLTSGQSIGKAHHLHFIASATAHKITTRVLASEVVVTYPSKFSVRTPEVQQAAERACIRALRAQAEQLLPQRLATLAANNGFSYKSVAIKRLKSRWGSCDHETNIVLNLYLMQLPWDCIDYVLLHELTHTEVLRHGPDFWQAMETKLPNVKQLRKAIRNYQPTLRGSVTPQTVA